MNSQFGGRKGIVSGAQRSASVILGTTDSLVGDLAQAISQSLKGVGQSLETIAKSIGDAANDLGQGVKVVSQRFAAGVGGPIKDVADGLGNIVKNVPIAGKPTAYLVKGVGAGLYYVVVSVGDVVGDVGEQVGSVGKSAAGVVVFTLVAGRSSATGIVTKANKRVSSILKRAQKSFKPTSRKRRTKRRRRSKRSRKRTKRRRRSKRRRKRTRRSRRSNRRMSGGKKKK